MPIAGPGVHVDCQVPWHQPRRMWAFQLMHPSLKDDKPRSSDQWPYIWRGKGGEHSELERMMNVEMLRDDAGSAKPCSVRCRMTTGYPEADKSRATSSYSVLYWYN